jgi:colanic acid biosynthesis glycosyl transferase WcaI
VRVLVLSQYYDPEPIPKPSEVTDDLQRRGHETFAIAELPNYPTGTLYPGYRLVPFVRERRAGGSRVLRVFTIPYHGHSAIGRIMNYCAFVLSAALGAFLMPRPDVIYVWHPPLTVGLAAWIIGILRRAPFVLDVQDIWPDEVLMTGMLREGRAASALRRLERFVYRRASHIIVMTEGAQRNLAQKGVPESKMTVLPHWVYGEMPDPSDASRKAAREDLEAGDAFIVTFAGNLGYLQGVDTVVRAAATLRSRTDVAFRIIGDGALRGELERLAADLKLSNIRFLGAMPANVLPAYLSASDALLVHLRSGDLSELVLPAKTLSYLAVGRPVIAAATGATEELVRACAAGLTLAPGDPIALAATIERLMELPPAERVAMGQRGRECVESRFSRSRIMDDLEKVLERASRPAAP